MFNPLPADHNFCCFLIFNKLIKSQLLGMTNECLNINIGKCLVSNLTNISNFQPLVFVGRGCKTQLQVTENLCYL